MKIVQIGANASNDDLSQHILSNYSELEFGLFVEPNSLHVESIKDCYSNYTNIVVENIAIKSPLQHEETLEIFYHTNDYPNYELASCDIEHIKKHLWCPHLHRDGEGEIKSFQVPCITIDALFDKYSITELDWLYLDVEGLDAQILLNTDWKKYKIKRIEFEYLHLGEDADKIKDMMIDMGYTQVDSLHEYDWAFELKIPQVKVLFFGRENRDEVWEYDFILKEILPEKEKVVKFLSLEQVRNSDEKFDVFVYMCRDPKNYPWGYMPTYEEALECVLKTNPKIIIQLSDEFEGEDLQKHNDLANYCDLFVRQHHHANYNYHPNTVHIPLGYYNDFSIKNKEILRMDERVLNWCFVGYDKSDRRECVDKLSVIQPNYVHLQTSDVPVPGISKQKLCNLYLNSVFSPSTRGWTTIEPNRLYEASICGSIPVLVCSKYEFEEKFKHLQNPPWIVEPDWESAANKCKELLTDLNKLQRMQDEVLQWWDNLMKSIRTKVSECLDEPFYNYRLRNFPPVNFISIEESEDRRKVLYEQFKKNGIKNITPHIFEKYNPDKHIIKTTDWWGRDKEGYLGATTSHIKAIKTWYETTDEPYAFFCEDDLSLETVQYWNFTWEQFFNSLPYDWTCVQMVVTGSDVFKFFQPEVHFRNRCWCDSAATAYLITREHAKSLLDNYYLDGETFFIEYKGIDKDGRDEWATYPTTETIVYSNFGKPIYTFPLFVENPRFDTTVWDLNGEVPQFHWPCYDAIMDWWKTRGKDMTLNGFFARIKTEINRSKLKNFPPIHFISIEESESRRNTLYQKFNKYGLTNITPHIYKKYSDDEHTIVGADADLLMGSGRGPVTSHLKAIKEWYETTDEPYAFFCEDDISFETVDYWNFTWEEFFNSLHPSWQCVQLCWVRENDMFLFSPDGLKVRVRCWCDWSAAAYLVSREHAEVLISMYHSDDSFSLEYKGFDRDLRPDWAYKPNAETIIFTSVPKHPVYSFPLFVEDVNTCLSTINSETNRSHVYSYNSIVDWWRTKGKSFNPTLDKKLRDFPTVNFISVDECYDRRKILVNKLEELKLKYTPHIFKRYRDEDHNIIGEDSHLLIGNGRGPLTSHLKTIKTWYETTDEPYAIFCEDDADFETVKYWNFTWEEFFEKLPSNWECVQLSLTREFYKDFNIPDFIENIKHNLSYFFDYDFHLRYRCWCDWSCVTYLMKRSHAKKIIDAYCPEDDFVLEYKGIDKSGRPEWAYKPNAETVIYSLFDWGTIYTFPLFVENSSFETTLSPDNNYNCVRSTCSDAVLNWWKKEGNSFPLDKIINERFYN